MINKETQLQKTYHANYNLLTVQDIWQTHYRTFLKNLAEEIFKFKCKYCHNDKNVKLAKINSKIASVFLITQTLNII